MSFIVLKPGTFKQKLFGNYLIDVSLPGKTSNRVNPGQGIKKSGKNYFDLKDGTLLNMSINYPEAFIR